MGVLDFKDLRLTQGRIRGLVLIANIVTLFCFMFAGLHIPGGPSWYNCIDANLDAV